MRDGYLYDCAAKRESLRRALKMFGPGAYSLMAVHLESRYGLKIESSPCSEVEDIEVALRDLVGTSADLIIARMRAYLRTVQVDGMQGN